MTLYDYLMLKEHKQFITLLDQGELVSILNNGGSYYQLYSLSIFFVEIEFEKWTNRMMGRAIFQSGAQLDKYLDQNLTVSI